MKYLLCFALVTGCVVDPRPTADPDGDATLADATRSDGSAIDPPVDALPDDGADASSPDAASPDAASPDAGLPICVGEAWQVVAEIDVPGAPRDLEVRGDRVYGVLYPQGLAIVNTVDPRAPRLQAVVDVQGAHALALSPAEPWGVVAALGDGVRIIDFSDPDVPREVGAYDLVGAAGAEYAQDIELLGATAFVAAGSQGVWAIDVADRSRPTGRHLCCGGADHPLTGPRSLALNDSVAVVADTAAGVYVTALDDGGVFGGALALPGAPQAIELVDVTAYVLVEDRTVYTVTNRQPGRLAVEATIAVPAPATAMRAIPDGVLVATGDGVWRLQQAAASQVLDLDGRAATSVLLHGRWMYAGVEDGLIVAERVCP